MTKYLHPNCFSPSSTQGRWGTLSGFLLRRGVGSGAENALNNPPSVVAEAEDAMPLLQKIICSGSDSV